MREALVAGLCLAMLGMGGCSPMAEKGPPREGKTVAQLFGEFAEAHGTDNWNETRAGVAEALDAMGAAAVPGLIEALDNESWKVREEAAFGLGRLGGEALPAMPALIAALEDKNFLVWEAVDGAIGTIAVGAGEKAVPMLIDTLKTGTAKARVSAAEALCHAGPAAREAIPALTAALKDPEGGVREAAAAALEEIKGE